MNLPLTTAELRQTLLPDAAELHLDFKTLREVHPFWWLEFGEISRQELGEYPTKIAVNLLPRRLQGVSFVSLELRDRIFDLLLVSHYSRQHFEKLGLLLFDAEGIMSTSQTCQRRFNIQRTFRSYP
jgi:hypothetical protein